MYKVCIDVGGTFTDCLVLDGEGNLHQFKSPTTPADPSVGLLAALEKASHRFGQALQEFLGQVELLIHGTTLATNTLINRDGAKTGMITTRFFRDVIEIRRGYKNVRTSMYNVFVPPYKPLVPRYLRLEAEERAVYSGEIVTPLNEQEVREAATKLRDQDVGSLAVCFLHSYANPQNERRAAEIAGEILKGVYITTSSDILPVWREWERFSTTVVSAYVGPVVEQYLRALVSRLQGSGFRGTLLMMLSDGLVETVDNCISRAVYLIGSGPAAGPATGVHVGMVAGHDSVVSFDMGGTSLDVSLIRNGHIPTTTEGWVQDERVAIKMVDVHSAGAGGGSIAWVDSLGLLRVGPQSAGSDPGPASYGKGGEEPTVTDADLLLGYVPADFFLGGEISLEREPALEAVKKKVAGPLGMSVPDAAQAIFTAVNSFMADQIMEISTRRGFDVRDVAIVAGGGAGPVHAAFIADLLSVTNVVVPSVAATYSAFGMFAMDVGRNYARSYIARANDIDLERVGRLYEDMELEALEAFRQMRVAREDVSFHRTADLRYIGQFHEVEVDVPAGGFSPGQLQETMENFHSRHEELYTFNMRWKGVEFLTFRLRASAAKAPFESRRIERGGSDASGALKRQRACWFDGREVDTSVYDGENLLAGNRVAGPAIIEESTTTVVVPARFTCEVDDWRNYLLTRDGGPVSPGGTRGGGGTS